MTGDWQDWQDWLDWQVWLDWQYSKTSRTAKILNAKPDFAIHRDAFWGTILVILDAILVPWGVMLASFFWY